VKRPWHQRIHTISSMRDHLLALQEINVALSKNEFDKRQVPLPNGGWA